MHAGTAGDYNYNCPLDQRFFSFVKVDADAFAAEVKAGRNDAELLAWVLAQSPLDLHPVTIAAWSNAETARAPNNTTYRAKFNAMHEETAPHRQDVVTSFDLLDLDDFVSFGGKA